MQHAVNRKGGLKRFVPVERKDDHDTDWIKRTTMDVDGTATFQPKIVGGPSPFSLPFLPPSPLSPSFFLPFPTRPYPLPSGTLPLPLKRGIGCVFMKFYIAAGEF